MRAGRPRDSQVAQCYRGPRARPFAPNQLPLEAASAVSPPPIQRATCCLIASCALRTASGSDAADAFRSRQCAQPSQSITAAPMEPRAVVTDTCRHGSSPPFTKKTSEAAIAAPPVLLFPADVSGHSPPPKTCRRAREGMVGSEPWARTGTGQRRTISAISRAIRRGTHGVAVAPEVVDRQQG